MVTVYRRYAKGVDNADAGYAYVIDWSQRYAPNALANLWNAGYRVRSAAERVFAERQKLTVGVV
ncbi:MAG: hypothetical protein U5J63_09990 [Fodinibius sp.]|nr:hypothetical protein [Fodinibius sp.]